MSQPHPQSAVGMDALQMPEPGGCRLSSSDAALWSNKAELWHEATAADGDANRRFNSDPVLWRMAGDVAGLSVLDAGCGTGYLSVLMAKAGATVTAVDYSEGMLEYARQNVATASAAMGSPLPVSLALDSCMELATVATASIDLIVSNYVLMDLVDLDAAIAQFRRVLRPGGRVVAIVSHPCFTVPAKSRWKADGATMYKWDVSYFEDRRFLDSWGKFATPFVVYARPLNAYWKCFMRNGFRVDDFDEPVSPPAEPTDSPERQARIWKYRMNPYSVAFLLRKE